MVYLTELDIVLQYYGCVSLLSLTLMISVAPDSVNEGLLAPEPLGDLVLTGEVGHHAAGGALEPRTGPRAGHRAHPHCAVLTHVANLRGGHTSAIVQNTSPEIRINLI